MGKLVRVRRRPRYPSVPMGGSLGEVGGPSPEDLVWGIVREACGACRGGILHLLSLELDCDRCGEFIVGEGSRSLCLYLGGRDSGFRMEIGPGASRVCFMGERVWLVGDGRHDPLAREGLRDDVVCVANERATKLLSEALCAFAGARGAFHVEAGGPTRPGGRPYDVYVRNACLAPYRRTIANVTFHVNCDATKEDWAAHAGAAVGPTGRGMGSSRADAEWLARRLQQSDAAPFLTPCISGGGPLALPPPQRKGRRLLGEPGPPRLQGLPHGGVRLVCRGVLPRRAALPGLPRGRRLRGRGRAQAPRGAARPHPRRGPCLRGRDGSLSRRAGRRRRQGHPARPRPAGQPLIRRLREKRPHRALQKEALEHRPPRELRRRGGRLGRRLMAASVRKLPGARWRRGQGGSRGTRRERGGQA